MTGVDVEGSVSQVEAPEPSAEPAVETPVEKAPYEPPSWVFESQAEEAPRAEPKVEPKTEAAQKQWEFPTFDPDLFARDGDRYMRWYQQQMLGPVAQSQIEHEWQLKELRDQLSSPAIHPALVNEQMRRAQNGLVSALQKFEADDAFSSPTLRKKVEDYYKGFLKEARVLAKKGDFSGIDAMADEDFHDTTFEYFKRKSGFKNGKPPASVASPELSLETPKGHAVAGDAKFSAEDEAAFKFAHEARGISRADFAKLIKIDAEQRGE